MAATPSIDRHLYEAPLPTSIALEDYRQNYAALTDIEQPGFFDAGFSPGGNYHVLTYRGPEIPYSSLLRMGDDSALSRNGGGQVFADRELAFRFRCTARRKHSTQSNFIRVHAPHCHPDHDRE